MRAVVFVSLVVTALGCQCAPANPQPVTLRVRNTSPDPIFVDETAGRHGLTVQRKTGTEWRGFAEVLPCACLDCDTVCNGCSCPPDAGSPPTVRKILPNESYARTWPGVVYTDGVNSCGFLGGGSACLKAENAPLDETFRLQLCYVFSITGLGPVNDGGTASGALPDVGQTCVGREFQPNDLEAEVTPDRGAACTSSAECTGKDELCFSGACTAGCPLNDFPQTSATWSVRLASVDDQGFFTSTTANGQTVLTGKGTVGSALYNSNSLSLTFTRPGTGGAMLTAGLDLTLPSGHSPAFTQGMAIDARVIDASSSTNPENRALILRDGNGVLLLLADVGQGGSLLQAADTAPFTVTWESAIVGCRAGDCGKELFSPVRISGPSGAISLQPGNTAPHTAPDGTYRLLNVGHSSWASTLCRFKVLRPFLLYRERP